MKENIDARVNALSAMLIHMGMYEDDWNKPTFDQARAALARARAEQAEPVRGYGNLWPNGNPSRGDLSPEEDCHAAAPAKLEPISRSEVVRIAMETGLQSSQEHWGTVYRAVSASNLEEFAAAIVEAAHNAKLSK